MTRFDASHVLRKENEVARLGALDSYGILDTPAERGFDDIVLLAAQICKTPVAAVSLVAGSRQWFKARIGLDACETPLSQSICVHALWRPGLLVIRLLVIPDLAADPRTCGNTAVTGFPHLRFYTGARLETPKGEALGTLCVADTKPRMEGLAFPQASALEALARQVMAQLELRRAMKALASRAAERNAYGRSVPTCSACSTLTLFSRAPTPHGARFWLVGGRDRQHGAL